MVGTFWWGLSTRTWGIWWRPLFNGRAIPWSGWGRAVIATDMSLVIRYWNRAAQELYGWTASEVLGRHLMIALPNTLTPEQLDELRSRARAGRPTRGTAVVQRRDGTTAPVFFMN